MWSIKLAYFVSILRLSTATPTRNTHSSQRHPLTFLPDTPQPRQEHSITVLNNNVIIVGGITSNYSYTPTTLNESSFPTSINTVQSYNIEKQTWSDLHPFPGLINHGNIATVHEKIYMLAGLSGTNFTVWAAIGDSYVYDPKLDDWSVIASMPPGFERGASAVGVYAGKIYLAGGMRSLAPRPEGLQDSVSSVSAYDTKTNTWDTNLPPLPEARDHVGGAVIGSKFYVVGGRVNGQFNVRGTTWALDLTNITAGWKVLASMPTPRGGLAATSAGHCVYTFGGEGNPAPWSNGVFDNVEVYNTRTGKWKVKKGLWAGIHGTNAVYGGDGKIYIAGGGYGVGAGTSNFTIGYKVDRDCFD